MRIRARSLLSPAAIALALASPAAAQLVPLTYCQSAIPCSIPFGLRPADSVAGSPYARTGQGNAVISVSAGVEEGLKPKIDRHPIAEDPSEVAARIFVRRNPPPTPRPSPPSMPK